MSRGFCGHFSLVDFFSSNPCRLESCPVRLTKLTGLGTTWVQRPQHIYVVFQKTNLYIKSL